MRGVLTADRITSEEMTLLLAAVRAVAHGPFVLDGDMHPVMGFDRSEIVDALTRWESVAPEDRDLMLRNAANNMLGYPIRQPERWSDFIPCDAAELNRIFDKYLGKQSTGSPKDYFDRFC